MRGHDDFAGRYLCADYFACVRKGPTDLHAEVDDNRRFALRRVVVNEAIVTVGPQAFMLAEKLPDKIKRRLSCSPNFPNAHAAPHCGERLRADGVGDDLIVHRKFHSEFICLPLRPIAPGHSRSTISCVRCELSEQEFSA